jgi:hypothetical protein
MNILRWLHVRIRTNPRLQCAHIPCCKRVFLPVYYLYIQTSHFQDETYVWHYLAVPRDATHLAIFSCLRHWVETLTLAVRSDDGTCEIFFSLVLENLFRGSSVIIHGGCFIVLWATIVLAEPCSFSFFFYLLDIKMYLLYIILILTYSFYRKIDLHPYVHPCMHEIKLSHACRW